MRVGFVKLLTQFSRDTLAETRSHFARLKFACPLKQKAGEAAVHKVENDTLL